MNALDRIRKHPSVAALPARWRPVFIEADCEPDGIAPACTDEGHEDTDGSVYGCCPEPVIEVADPHVAEYLAALLNADRGVGR
ncbi:hypothetical protein [Streptomyces sp. NPDC002467]|uniref:hypothetical protein n=1 Tax=Streptomyces sp. NPDC002467 TaxID=3364647 RepID=UPI0036CABDD0